MVVLLCLGNALRSRLSSRFRRESHVPGLDEGGQYNPEREDRDQEVRF